MITPADVSSALKVTRFGRGSRLFPLVSVGGDTELGIVGANGRLGQEVVQAPCPTLRRLAVPRKLFLCDLEPS